MIVLNYILVSIGVVVLFIPAAILRGWAISVLWGWFVVPTGLPPLGIAHAIGLSIVAGLLVHQYIPGSDKKETYQPLAYLLLMPVLAVGLGWIVKGYL